MRDDGTRADIARGPNLQRRYQRGVTANESIIANLRFVLTRAVVVTRDGAGADVGMIADLRIAQVRQVIGFRARTQARILQFHEIADPRILTDVVAGP